MLLLPMDSKMSAVPPAVQNLLVVGAGAVGTYYLREHFKGGVCTSSARMDGKTVVITGCNTGIGKETVRDLAGRGARVVMACRNLEAAAAAAEDVKSSVSDADLAVYELDLSSLQSVRRCAAEIGSGEKRVDVLVNNAGVMMCPKSVTEDGFETQIGTNHFGHFLFTNLLLDKLKKSAPSRVVTVSSRAHQRGQIDLEDINFQKRKYSSLVAYEQSKLANVLFTRELSRRLKGTGVTCYSLHPGVVRTELGRHIEKVIGPLKYALWPMIYFFTKSPREGAQTSIFCCVDEALDGESGKYYADCKEKQPMPQDDEMARKLWDLSEDAVGIKKKKDE